MMKKNLVNNVKIKARKRMKTKINNHLLIAVSYFIWRSFFLPVKVGIKIEHKLNIKVCVCVCMLHSHETVLREFDGAASSEVLVTFALVIRV